jgi:hypothetical protein
MIIVTHSKALRIWRSWRRWRWLKTALQGAHWEGPPDLRQRPRGTYGSILAIFEGGEQAPRDLWRAAGLWSGARKSARHRQACLSAKIESFPHFAMHLPDIYVLEVMNVRTKSRELDGPANSATLIALARLLARQAASEVLSSRVSELPESNGSASQHVTSRCGQARHNLPSRASSTTVREVTRRLHLCWGRDGSF